MGTLSKAFENQSLAERFKSKAISTDACLLLDISGSMSSDCEPGRSKIEALRDIIKGIIGNPTLYAFDSRVEKVDKNSIPAPHGSTFMGRAIERAKADGFTSAIMITDGEASDPDDALNSVKDFKLQVMYVGPGPRPPFLDKLASGFVSSHNLSQPKEISEKIQLLLNPGSDNSSNTGNGVIEL